MTTPAERTRALRRAGEFIQELVTTGELSEKRKHEALVILRHYPTTTEIELQFAIGRYDVAEGQSPGIKVPPELGFNTLGQLESKSIEGLQDPNLEPLLLNHGRFAHLYGVLTAQEMADHLKCSPEAVYERAVAGEFIFLSSSARVDDRRYPAFQLDERLDKSLLKQTIQEYRDADVNSTLLWVFLRSPQKIYAGLTAIEMLVGGMPPEYDTLTPDERSEIFLDVVAEEISRVR